MGGVHLGSEAVFVPRQLEKSQHVYFVGPGAEQFAAGVDVVMMERHGLSVVSPNLDDAFLQTDLAEEAARIAYYWHVLEGVGR